MMVSDRKGYKEYSRFIPYLCYFCQKLKKKDDLLLIHLPNTQTVVKTCLKCREIIDRKHKMETEKLE